MMKTTLRVIVGCCMAAGMALAADPVVTNVRAAQRPGTKLVDIWYDVSGTTTPAYVSLQISSNGGTAFAVPATALSGDLGSLTSLGRNKHIIWNAGADWNGQVSNTMRFRVAAHDPNIPRILLSDNFEGVALDTGKWLVSKNKVEMYSGIVRVGTDQTDYGGILSSVPLSIMGRKPISVQRKARIHRGNNYFSGFMVIRFGGLRPAGIHYCNYVFSDSVWMPRSGTFIGKNIPTGWEGDLWEHPIRRSRQDDVSASMPLISDAWFDEKVVYSPDSGILEYYVNGQKLGEYAIGTLPLGEGQTMQITIRAWGWWTGHEQLSDDFVVSQEL